MATPQDASFPLDALSLTKAREQERNLLRDRELAAWKTRQPAKLPPAPPEPAVIVVTDPATPPQVPA